MVITLEDYGKIRKMYIAGKSYREISRELKISRNTVAKYCKGETVPWHRNKINRKSSVVTDEVLSIIKACFQEDQNERIRKQSHSARKIFNRLRREKVLRSQNQL